MQSGRIGLFLQNYGRRFLIEILLPDPYCLGRRCGGSMVRKLFARQISWTLTLDTHTKVHKYLGEKHVAAVIYTLWGSSGTLLPRYAHKHDISKPATQYEFYI